MVVVQGATSAAASVMPDRNPRAVEQLLIDSCAQAYASHAIRMPND